MSTLAEFQRAISTAGFRRVCAPFEIETMESAFDGDPEAARILSVTLRNDRRGHMAVAMWRAKVSKEAFREYFSSAWDHDHRHVIHAAETRRTLACLFRYAAFPLPAELPETIPVWRGTSKLTTKEAKQGYSWTTNRDVACWFAMRFASHNGSPLVLSANVTKADIALFHSEREESEAVLLRPPAVVRIDGNPDDWQQGYARAAAFRSVLTA